MPVFIAKVASPQECFEKVKAKGWPAFGTQYGQECWSSKDADKTYWKHGKSTRCKNNMGNDLANDVWIIHCEYLAFVFVRIQCTRGLHI